MALLLDLHIILAPCLHFNLLPCLQMERALTSEQRRSDFMGRDDALSFDKPTPACLLGTALLAALGDAVAGTLDGQNKKHFLNEVSSCACA